MIILDTNVLSAIMNPTDNPEVVDWLDRQDAEAIWTTAITVFEIEFGIGLLPPGRRRIRYEDAFARAIGGALQGRVLPLDQTAAEAAGRLAAARQRAGRPMDFRDVQIAGIAFARGATVATRNVRHFGGMDLEIVDPWAE